MNAWVLNFTSIQVRVTFPLPIHPSNKMNCHSLAKIIYVKLSAQQYYTQAIAPHGLVVDGWRASSDCIFSVYTLCAGKEISLLQCPDGERLTYDDNKEKDNRCVRQTNSGRG